MSGLVLVFGEYGILNGGERSFLACLPDLQNFGWELQAAVPSDSEFAESLKSHGVRHHALSLFENGQRKSQDAIRAAINSLIRHVGPDLIHCNSLSTSRLCGPVARDQDTPSLGYLRDILKLSSRAIDDINTLDRIIAVSNATRNWHCEQGIDPEKTHVVYNGIDTATFCPAADTTHSIRNELQIPSSAPVLLYVGQIGIRKGVDVLVEAFLKVVSLMPDAHLLIVGQRHSQKREAIEFEQRILDQVWASKHGQQIHWLGRRNDIPELMRAATLLVHPARQEPLGRVLLEAAGSGLPMVTTRVGGTEEILFGSEFEILLVAPNDSEVLANRVIELLQQPKLLDSLQLSLRSHVLGCFTNTICASQLNQHYDNLVSN